MHLTKNYWRVLVGLTKYLKIEFNMVINRTTKVSLKILIFIGRFTVFTPLEFQIRETDDEEL